MHSKTQHAINIPVPPPLCIIGNPITAKKGKKIVIFDRPNGHQPSSVAACLFNPINDPRVVKVQKRIINGNKKEKIGKQTK